MGERGRRKRAAHTQRAEPPARPPGPESQPGCTRSQAVWRKAVFEEAVFEEAGFAVAGFEEAGFTVARFAVAAPSQARGPRNQTALKPAAPVAALPVPRRPVGRDPGFGATAQPPARGCLATLGTVRGEAGLPWSRFAKGRPGAAQGSAITSSVSGMPSGQSRRCSASQASRAASIRSPGTSSGIPGG